MSYIGNEPIISATRTITEVLATAGQTVFTANGGYTVGYLDVFVNGVQLQTSDYTASNGSTVTLGAPCALNDDVRLVAWGTFSTSNLNGNSLVDGSVTQAKLASGVAGNGPAFSAYAATAQTGITSGAETKILFGTENFDTNSNFASSRFTPTVAGYYQINSTIAIVPAGASSNWVTLFKNGAYYSRGARIFTEASRNVNCTISDLVYCNGTTDYVEIYGFSNGGTWNLEAGTTTYFNGFLARAA